ncbi:hypothetical protein [Massilia pseudoviolaceinigra]|uniref:hypothetical protein n=1 Tax=Massilia pseudoviolaceinigra TaxID=3057165 RepID=UPI002796CD9D|nr:hypothetical protein [Massilia sp. CCM 9206]MDQ1921187.1 hypothetical protein [Massilia sp. CCM 9206]
MDEYWYCLIASKYDRDLGWFCAPLAQEGAKVTEFRMNGETIPLEKIRIDPPYIRFIVDLPSGVTDASAKISARAPSTKINTQIVVALITVFGTIISAYLLFLGKTPGAASDAKPGPSLAATGVPGSAGAAASAGLSVYKEPQGASVGANDPVGGQAAQTQQLIPPSETTSSTVRVGSVGWIYVGSRIDGEWGRSAADGIEPPKTLRVANLPSAGSTYTVITPVYVRSLPPKEMVDKSRPPMEKSIGALGPGTTVKVDVVKSVQVDDPEPRTWIWAHVTVTGMGY